MGIFELLEKAEIGGPELDLAVGKYLGEIPEDAALHSHEDEVTQFAKVFGAKPPVKYYMVAPYTTSLDAAWSLLPEGWILTSVHVSHPGWKCGSIQRVRVGTVNLKTHMNEWMEKIGEHKHLPIAMVLAALKAREAVKTPDEYGETGP